MGESSFIESADGMVWAEAFCAHVGASPGADPTDPGWLVGWFANAMAAAERAGRAEAWAEGAYAAGYDTCSPEDNPYRDSEAGR